MGYVRQGGISSGYAKTQIACLGFEERIVAVDGRGQASNGLQFFTIKAVTCLPSSRANLIPLKIHQKPHGKRVKTEKKVILIHVLVLIRRRRIMYPTKHPVYLVLSHTSSIPPSRNSAIWIWTACELSYKLPPPPPQIFRGILLYANPTRISQPLRARSESRTLSGAACKGLV